MQDHRAVLQLDFVNDLVSEETQRSIPFPLELERLTSLIGDRPKHRVQCATHRLDSCGIREPEFSESIIVHWTSDDGEAGMCHDETPLESRDPFQLAQSRSESGRIILVFFSGLVYDLCQFSLKRLALEIMTCLDNRFPSRPQRLRIRS